MKFYFSCFFLCGIFLACISYQSLQGYGQNTRSQLFALESGMPFYQVGDSLFSLVEDSLVWADEFNTGSMIDTGNWTYETGYVRNNEIQYYTVARAENCRIEDGFLIITGREDTPPYPTATGAAHITSASITTKGKHAWQHGYFEIRAKVPTGQGPWAAFWAKGDNQNRGVPWPACGEIDIMEYAAQTPVMIQNLIYGSTYNDYQQQTLKINRDFSDNYHIYSLKWTAKQMTFAIDHIVTHTVNLDDLPFPEIFKQPFFILLNLALGTADGSTIGGRLDKNCLPAEFRVDYIRVYQNKK